MMIRSRPQPDDAHPGMLDVKNLATDELTAGLRRSRQVCRPGRGACFLGSRCARFHGSDLRAGRLCFTLNAPEVVRLDRQAPAGGAQCSSASAKRRTALTRADHDALGTSAVAPERANSELKAIAHFDAGHQHVVMAVKSGHVDAGRTDGAPNA